MSLLQPLTERQLDEIEDDAEWAEEYAPGAEPPLSPTADTAPITLNTRRQTTRYTHHPPLLSDTADDDDEVDYNKQSLYARVTGWRFFTPFRLRIRGKFFFNVCAWLLCAIQIGLTIALAVTGNYGLDAYTLWSFTMLTVFACALALAVIVEQLPLTLVVQWGLPIVLGNVVAVAIAIIIILQNNIQLFIDGTKCDVPPPSNPTSLALKHTGDWLLHGWPVFGMLLLLIGGMDYFGRLIIVHAITVMSSVGQWLYFVYWFVAPLVPLIIYDLAFDVDKMYPTSFTWIERALILIAIMWIWMAFVLGVFTMRTQYGQIRYAFMASAADRRRNPYALHSQQSLTPEQLQLQARVGGPAPVVNDSF
jgi:hypothetical protein